VVAFNAINRSQRNGRGLGAVVTGRVSVQGRDEGQRQSAAGNFVLDASLERALIQRPLGDMGNSM
jgi:hypothetical protein